MIEGKERNSQTMEEHIYLEAKRPYGIMSNKIKIQRIRCSLSNHMNQICSSDQPHHCQGKQLHVHLTR